MGCQQCISEDAQKQLAYTYKSLTDGNTDSEKRATKKSKVKIDESLLKKFEEEIENHGEKISEEQFNEILGEKLVNFHKMYFYTDPNYKEDRSLLIEPGPIKFKNGNDTVYKGTWNSNGKMDGLGEYHTLLNGQKLYINGIWDDGDLKKGKVKIGNNTYDGDIQNGLFNGKGKMEYADGSYFEGKFKDGTKKNGVLTFNNGTVFEGDFENDEIGKNGKFTWPDGKTYQGNLKNGIFDGRGTLKDPEKGIYEGEFKNGIYHGKGKYTWYDEYTKEKGDTYNGEYFDGKKNGYGVYNFKDGSKIEGCFESGELQGECYYDKDGYKYTIQYAFGNPQDIYHDEIPDYEGNREYPIENAKDLNVELKEENIQIQNLENLNTAVIKELYLPTEKDDPNHRLDGYKFNENKDANESSMMEGLKIEAAS